MSAGAPTARAVERSAARLQAVQALYQIEIADADVGAAIDQVTRYGLGREVEGADRLADADSELFVDIVRGLSARQGEIDQHINEALCGRGVARLDNVVRAIVRAGAYELAARADIPARVVINEYVDLAHAFFDGGQASFVNGVLDRLARALRGAELEAADHDGTTPAR